MTGSVMSYISLQFGQCGNQLGCELFSVIDSDINVTKPGVSVRQNRSYGSSSREKWFRESNGKHIARAVLVDTEKKVVKSIKEQMKRSDWGYDIKNCITDSSSGSANNWALGYNVKGPEILDSFLEVVRKEFENCDRVENVLCFSSSAGGTGSGAGSYLTEQLCDEVLHKSVMNFLILPFRSGEVVTQNFNTLLTVSKLYDKSDGIFLIENDDAHKTVSSQLKIQNVMYTDINKLIAQQIASIFQPVSNINNITDVLMNLVSHSLYKLLSLKTTPHIPEPSTPFEPVEKWESLQRNLEKTLRLPWEVPVGKTSQHNLKRPINYYRTVGNVLIYRGTHAGEAITMPSVLESDPLYTKWIPKNSRFSTLNENRQFYSHNRFLTMVSNNSSVSLLLEDLIEKSWSTFIHNAYVHQYSKYGVENDEFLEMFFKTEQILKNYKNL